MRTEGNILVSKALACREWHAVAEVPCGFLSGHRRLQGKPPVFALFPGAADLKPVAEEVERETMRMITESK